MRPINRGDAPENPLKKYQEATEPLIQRLGGYCSYCERRIKSALAVEHKSPKKADGKNELEWSNFLLSCVNCNSCKGSQPISMDDYLWPDLDNTLRAFEYSEHSVSASMFSRQEGEEKRAMALLKLVGLDKVPGHPNLQSRDKRWRDRKETWELACRYLQRLLNESGSADARQAIVDLAQAHGGFSIWFTVFGEDADMRQRLIKAFVGTAEDCFDDCWRPLRRPNGKV